MPEYTFGPAPVLIEATGEFAIGATGVLRATEDGQAVQVYDLNDSPLPSIAVGPKGAHQAFRADVPNGVLDFGSVLLPKVCDEAQVAALTAQEVASGAATDAATALAAVTLGLEQIVFAGDNATTPRPNVPLSRTLLWLCSSTPVNAAAGDYWWPINGLADGGQGGGSGAPLIEPVEDPANPGLWMYPYPGVGIDPVEDPENPGLYTL
jgi:hypothetical protein